MSNPLKSVGKVFKGVAKVAKSVAPVALPAAAMFLTGGLAGGGAGSLFGAGGSSIFGGGNILTSLLSQAAPAVLGGDRGGGDGGGGVLDLAGKVAVDNARDSLTQPTQSKGGFFDVKASDLLNLGGGIFGGISEEQREREKRDFIASERDKQRQFDTVKYQGGNSPWTPTYKRTATQAAENYDGLIPAF